MLFSLLLLLLCVMCVQPNSILCGAWLYCNFFINVTVTSLFFNTSTIIWVWICLWCYYCYGVGINNQNTIWR
jgi:hypothetical protein